jgi:enamine deaminase RidA (YjgF/YER057c/UK114 family)
VPSTINGDLDFEFGVNFANWIMVREILFIGLIVFLSGSRIVAQPLATPASRMAAAGIQLPEPNRPIGNYVTWVRTGDLLFLSGHGSCGAPGPVDRGKLGQDLDIEQGYQAARNVGLCMLATLHDALGDLARVKRVVRVSGMVNATADFTDHPKVMNGFSDLMVEVFGEAGRHVRAAVGMASLPQNMSVEVEMLVELHNDEDAVGR